MAQFNPSFANQITRAGDQTTPAISVLKGTLARVIHVVLGPNILGTNIPDRYYKDPTSLGTIIYQKLDGTDNRTSNSFGNPPAKPLNFSFRQYPIPGELVEIYQGPSTGMNENIEAPEYYYTMPINLWNGNHHNAFPDLGDYSQFTTSTRRSYDDSQLTNQANNVSVTSSVNFPLGPNFPERGNIKTLRAFPGDIIVEGRWGNSIRFGSTSAEGKEENTWSKSGVPGNPITIIRNGQGRQAEDVAWIPTVENINRDPSSIYLTEGQEIVIDDINNNFSLASLDISLQRTITVSIPIQQQLTSTDNISALEQDRIITGISEETTNATNPVQRATTTPTTSSPTETQNRINVVGDYQNLFGTYVVSLRAVNQAGTILASVSATEQNLDNAYQDAVTQLKSRNLQGTLDIPPISKLTKG